MSDEFKDISQHAREQKKFSHKKHSHELSRKEVAVKILQSLIMSQYNLTSDNEDELVTASVRIADKFFKKLNQKNK